MDTRAKATHKELFGLFLKLGISAFGGPAAHIAMMQDEVVHKRAWMDDEHYLDLVGATQLIPGPNSTEMALHCGFDQRGWTGMLAAGAGFLLPATFLTGILAWFYVRYQKVPMLGAFLFGIKPAVLAIILSAVYKLGKKALKSWQLGVIGLIVATAAWFGLGEVLSILAGGLLWMLWHTLHSKLTKPKDKLHTHAWPLLPLLGSSWTKTTPLLFATASVAKHATLSGIFWTFLKVGAVLFGSGYVLIAYLDGELVKSLGWLTHTQLLDAIAIGQFTPGPVLSTSTFIGYQLKGFWGAILATVGIFLPSFFFVAALNPLIPKLRSSRWASAFLDGVNIGAMGLMAAVCIRLGAGVLPNWRAITIFTLAIAVTFLPKKSLSSVWIVFGGATLGYLLQLV